MRFGHQSSGVSASLVLNLNSSRRREEQQQGRGKQVQLFR